MLKAKLQRSKKRLRVDENFICVENKEEEVDGNFTIGQRNFLIRKIKDTA